MPEIDELDTLDEEEMEEGLHHSHVRRRQAKNKNTIIAFMGAGRRHVQAAILPNYYGGLLTWAGRRFMERSHWQVQRTLGYRYPEPAFVDVATGINQSENLLWDGQMLILAGDLKIILTMDISPRRSSVVLSGPVRRRKVIDAAVESILKIAREENFYRGQKLEYNGRINILDIKERNWESVIIPATARREIIANTVDFLRQAERWEQFGIPAKRGVLLSGEPGTGKTIICRALMAQATGMTCLTASAYCLGADEYISDLYELAQDLCPCLVFIEDIDLIGQDRMEFGYSRGPALLSLLAEMDGVEEKKQIVSVATTNCLELLDKALSQRPSRFDRVIRLTRPVLAERQELIHRLCRKVPLADNLQDYIARRTEGCTPAQLQEIVFGLAVERGEELTRLTFRDADGVISLINGRFGQRLGFTPQTDAEGLSLSAVSRNRISGDEKSKT
jgi:cell division protease FtsH